MAIALATPPMLPLPMTFMSNADMMMQTQSLVKSCAVKRRRSDSAAQCPRKIRRIASSFPDRSTEFPINGQNNDRSRSEIGNSSSAAVIVSPHDYIVSTIRARGGDSCVRPSLGVKSGFFHEHSEEEMRSYSILSRAVRSRDLPKLRQLHEENGMSMRCSNKFGESLIHMACRRGDTDMARFLVQEAGVSVRVRDDYGKTPLHDACWTSEPNTELMDMLLVECPEMLMMCDKRGHTPFQYARKDHWVVWKKFLEERVDLISAC